MPRTDALQQLAANALRLYALAGRQTFPHGYVDLGMPWVREVTRAQPSRDLFKLVRVEQEGAESRRLGQPLGAHDAAPRKGPPRMAASVSNTAASSACSR